MLAAARRPRARNHCAWLGGCPVTVWIVTDGGPVEPPRRGGTLCYSLLLRVNEAVSYGTAG